MAGQTYALAHVVTYAVWILRFLQQSVFDRATRESACKEHTWPFGLWSGMSLMDDRD
jgi:hypothetical protein